VKWPRDRIGVEPSEVEKLHRYAVLVAGVFGSAPGVDLRSLDWLRFLFLAATRETGGRIADPKLRMALGDSDGATRAPSVRRVLGHTSHIVCHSAQ
jgi:hypothetical protein